MSDHSLPEQNTSPVAKLIELKVIAASAVTLFASLALSLLNALQNDSSILSGLPPWLQFVLITSIPPLATFAAGYALPSNRV